MDGRLKKKTHKESTTLVEPTRVNDNDMDAMCQNRNRVKERRRANDEMNGERIKYNILKWKTEEKIPIMSINLGDMC